MIYDNYKLYCSRNHINYMIVSLVVFNNSVVWKIRLLVYIFIKLALQ